MSVFGTVKYASHANSAVDNATVTSNTASGDLIIVSWCGTVDPTGGTAVPTDTIGNTYVLDTNAHVANGFGTKQYMFYCLGSIGANGSNSISLSLSSNSSGVMQVWSVPLSGGTALFDTVAKAAPTSGTNPATATFNTAGTDEFVAVGVTTTGTWSSEATAGSGFTLDGASTGAGSVSHFAGEHIVYSSTQTGITGNFTQGSSANYAIVAVAIKANPLFSISGSAAAGAIVYYSGTASGSVTADGSGNYSITNLANGSYVVWATCAFQSFSPLTSSQTVSGSNITGVNFTPTASAFGTPVVVNNTATTSTTVTATTNTAARDLIVITTVSDHSTAPTGIADTVGNTYTQAGTVTQLPTGSTYLTMWYCAKSIGANASNVITVTYSGSTTGSVFVRNVPLAANKKAVFDVTQVGSSNTGTALATASFNTAGADEIVLVGAGIATVSGTLLGQNGYLLDNGGSGLTLERLGGQSVLFGATQTGITSTMTSSGTAAWVIRAVGFSSADDVFAVSGTVVDGSAVAISGVTISWTGTASGSTTTDGSGNWTTSVVNGSYTFTPTKTGYLFSPTSTNETVSNAAITGVNFTGTHQTTATPVPSPVAGTYGSTQSVTLTCSTPASSMFYTTDGSTPTSGSTPYTVPISVAVSLTIKALATATGFIDSAILTAAYVITYAISGSVGAIAAGATISYTGPSSGSVTADGSGNFSIPGLAPGAYTVTPSLAGYTFNPSNQIVVITNANVTGVDFIATFTPIAIGFGLNFKFDFT